MPYLRLICFTNDPVLAQIAEDNEVDFVAIDLELLGKVDRQGHLDTRISYHQPEDIGRIRPILQKSRLMVRINSIHKHSEAEIQTAIQSGADIIMLPYFKTVDEVKTFHRLVDGRSEVCLLVETAEAMRNIDAVLEAGPVDCVHIGLNDLSISLGQSFLFEPLLEQEFINLCATLRHRQIPFGFGGVAHLQGGLVPAERILAEHYRLGSSMVILARSFMALGDGRTYPQIRTEFTQAITDIRAYEDHLHKQTAEFFTANRAELERKIREIVDATRD